MEFLNQMPWVVWAVLAVVLIIAEMVVSGFFIFWFGLAAVPTAVVAYFFPHDIILQLIVYIVVSIALLLSTRKLVAKMYASNANVAVGIDRLIGKCGPVLETIDPDAGKGLVRIDHEQWRAESADGAIIETGSKIEVLKIDGTRVVVKKTDKPADGPTENCKEA